MLSALAEAFFCASFSHSGSDSNPQGGSVSMKISWSFELQLGLEVPPRRFLPAPERRGSAAGSLLNELVLTAGGSLGTCFTVNEDRAFRPRSQSGGAIETGLACSCRVVPRGAFKEYLLILDPESIEKSSSFKQLFLMPPFTQEDFRFFDHMTKESERAVSLKRFHQGWVV